MTLKPWVTPTVVTRSSAISEEKRKRIVALHAEGLAHAVIAERLGLHRNTVANWLARLCLVQRRSCTCGRQLRGADQQCYVCRGYRESTR